MTSSHHRHRRATVAPLIAVLVLAATVTAATVPAGAQAAPPTSNGPEIASGREAIETLGPDLAEVATDNGLTAAELRSEFRADATLSVDRNGELLYIDPPAPGEAPRREDSGAESSEAGPPTTDPVFTLHSRPGADHTIYLDFDGHTTSGTSWNSASGIDPIVSPAYNISGTADTWSAGEITRIGDIWNRVVEDYSPFDIDVTTEEPPVEMLRRTGGGDTQWGVRVVLTADTWADCTCGGHAYIGAFDDVADEPAFVYNSSLAGAAEAASHEVGHTMWLAHDGTSSTPYYWGHGSGATSWAPLMGASYSTAVTQWSKGDYHDANNNSPSANYGNGADDLAVISNLTNGNGFGYRPDDHGNTTSAATALAGPSFNAAGVIETTSDMDVFSFTTVGGTVTIDVTPWAGSANLDIDARLLDGAGAQIASSNPTDALNATFNRPLAAGTYHLTVDGTGTGTPLADPPSGYSQHASLGQYTVSGTTIPRATRDDAIVFVSNRDGDNEIFIMDTDGSNQTQLTDNETDDDTPKISPDGTTIAFTSERDGNREIVLMGIDGSNQIDLTDSPADDSDPTWSPDGSMIAYASSGAGTSEIFVMNADGTGQKPVTAHAPFLAGEPAWSPDGTRLAYTANLGGDVDIRTMDPDGSHHTAITDNGRDDARPAWSTDGGYVIFSSAVAGGDEIYTMSSGGAGSTNLTDHADEDRSPAASGDGATIAFATNRDGNFEIYAMDRDGGAQTNLTNAPGDDIHPHWGTASAPCTTHRFNDVPMWIEPATIWATCNSHMYGFGNLFKPTVDMTRGQVANLLYNVAGAPDVSDLPAHGFSDVPTWVDDAVTWLVDKNYATGYATSPPTFKPLRPITRAAVSRMLFRIKGSLPGSPPHAFTDVPRWATNAVNWITDPANTPRYATGFGSTFKPSDNITRAQTTRMVCRINASAGSC